MKVYVTGVDGEGRSLVLSREEFAPPQDGLPIVYDFEPNSTLDAWIDGIGKDKVADWIGPQVSGGARWILAQVPPHGFDNHPDGLTGMDEKGFHATNTIDFVYVLAGDLELILDHETIALEPGDVIIQQATRHAWRNGDQGSTHIALLLWPERAAG